MARVDEKNLCFTTRYSTATPGIGDRLNSANRKSLVFNGRKKPGNGAGSKAVLLLPLVLCSCYIACLSGRFADKERLWDDSMVPEKRRGCPLESGRKGGRNKSSASNRGRASARRHDKIPPRRRRPLLECRHHYEL
ncbi:uncharacterized protein LOC105840349 [Monomorium pharaonis]|uniref:uncharacterized protein LOC105840349 n=1 Tax=Monomorium pharaonis TaxID=307658 RepID=UPI00102E122B|nr:uncharacterized protein LOC105840349 [Monomorium pharaonis]